MNSVTISIDGYSFNFDPNLMFQRLLAAVILKKDAINLEHVFMYEICTYPPRLIQSEKFLLPADNKSQLKQSWAVADDSTLVNCQPMKCVINGGMMIQRIPWKAIPMA